MVLAFERFSNQVLRSLGTLQVNDVIVIGDLGMNYEFGTDSDHIRLMFSLHLPVMQVLTRTTRF